MTITNIKSILSRIGTKNIVRMAMSDNTHFNPQIPRVNDVAHPVFKNQQKYWPIVRFILPIDNQEEDENSGNSNETQNTQRPVSTVEILNDDGTTQPLERTNAKRVLTLRKSDYIRFQRIFLRNYKSNLFFALNQADNCVKNSSPVIPRTVVSAFDDSRIICNIYDPKDILLSKHQLEERKYRELPPELTPSEQKQATESEITTIKAPTKAEQVSLVKISSNYKTYSKIISWNGHSYTLRERLPDSTTPEEWDTIVDSYEAILKTQNQYAGVASLTLKLNQATEQMEIDIPARSEKITVKNTEHPAVNGLLNFYKNHDLESFKASLTQNSTPRDIQDETNAASKTPRNIDLIPATTDVHTIIRGIPNLGNTCFIASVCQSWLIYQEDALKKKLSQHPEENETKVISELLKWIENYKRNSQVSIYPILNLLKQNKSQWFNSQKLIQQDAHEFMKWLSQFMVHEEIKNETTYEMDVSSLKNEQSLIPQDSPPSSSSSHISLSLTSDKTTLESLVHQYFNPKLDNIQLSATIASTSNEITTKNLPVKSQKDRFVTAPQELNFQIKRFTQDSKLNNEVDMKEILELDGKKYKLDSIVIHQGKSKDSGHYVAYVRKKDPRTGEDHFELANDGTISQVSMEAVLSAAKQAYLIRYTRI